MNVKLENTKNLTKAQQEQIKILSLLEDGESPEENPTSDFAQLFEKSIQDNDIRVGDVVKGRVVEVQSDYVLVDIKYKSEGLIPIGEFRVVDGQNSVSPGDEVEVYIERIENENGMVV